MFSQRMLATKATCNAWRGGPSFAPQENIVRVVYSPTRDTAAPEETEAQSGSPIPLILGLFLKIVDGIRTFRPFVIIRRCIIDCRF